MDMKMKNKKINVKLNEVKVWKEIKVLNLKIIRV